jgi:hypothetical protein
VGSSTARFRRVTRGPVVGQRDVVFAAIGLARAAGSLELAAPEAAMTIWCERVIRCPRCGIAQVAQVARGANAGRDPHLRDDVLGRRLHRVVCSCGLEIRVEATFEYLDIERRQLLLVGRADSREAWPDLEARLRTIVRGALEQGSPLLQPFVRDVQSRVVLGAEALREKLVVWEAALDDALVECIKLRAFAADPSLAAPGSRLIVDAVGADDALACWWSPRADAPPARRLELPARWVRDASRDRGSLEARFSELFGGGFVDVRRFLSLTPPAGGGRSSH